MNEVDLLFQAHIELMNKLIPTIDNRNGKIAIPFFTETHLKSVLLQAKDAFRGEGMLVDIEVPIVAVGDLRGNIFNLYNIMHKYELPPARRFLFLGNILGEAGFSLEVMMLIMAMKSIFPRHVFVIRGENEFQNSPIMNIFMRELSAQYSPELSTAVFDALAEIPLATKIFSNILCIHAGLPMWFQNLEELGNIDKRTLTLNNPLIKGFVGQFCDQMLDNSEVLNEFMDKNEISLIIRGHEKVAQGILISPDERIVTIYSGSADCSSLLEITSLDEISTVAMDPLPRIYRKDTIYSQSKQINKCYDTSSMVLPPLRSTLSNQTATLNVLNSSPVVSMSHPIHSELRSFQKLQMITRINAVGAPQINQNFKPKFNKVLHSRYFRNSCSSSANFKT